MTRLLPKFKLDIRRILGLSNRFDIWLDNLSNTRRVEKQAISIAVDAVVAFFALWLSWSLRLGEFYSDFGNTWHHFIIASASTILIFIAMGVYRWVVRTSNQALYQQLLKASVLSSVVLLFTMYLVPPIEGSNPRSIFIFYGVLVFTATVSIRLVWRGLFDTTSRGQPVAIYGAGSAGRQLTALLEYSDEIKPVVFIDDNEKKIGQTIGGLKVLGGQSEALEQSLLALEVKTVILAMPSISKEQYSLVTQKYRNSKFKIKTLPPISELLSERLTVDQIRDVSVADYLGRTEVEPNIELMQDHIAGKKVLVTGGGGSIGSELCRQVTRLGVGKLVVMDNCEENLYHITEELSKLFEAKGRLVDFVPLLGDVNDQRQVISVISRHSIEVIFHAAAYKHVPIIERQPEQGVKVNIFGTLNTLNAAIDANVEQFTLISTDKAVRPTSAMGATKRIAEMVLQAKAVEKNVKTTISMVRFGNVLGSSGSVIHKFRQQIKEGGPITVTHKEITRYFMTIPEAACLVIQASAIAEGGEVFVLDMGEPVKIVDLAEAMVLNAGLELQSVTGDPGHIKIVESGLRPGEKMYEELFMSSGHEYTDLRKVMVAQEDYLSWKELYKKLTKIEDACVLQEGDAKNSLLKSILLATIKLEHAVKYNGDGPLPIDVPVVEPIKEEKRMLADS